jgi:hypothetical protein
MKVQNQFLIVEYVVCQGGEVHVVCAGVLLSVT